MLTLSRVSMAGLVAVLLSIFVSSGASYAVNPEILLNKTLKDVNVKTTLDKAIPEITKLTGLKMSVDWQGLSKAGVNRDAPIEIASAKTTSRDLLNTCLAMASKTDKSLMWYIDDKSIAMTTKESFVARTAVMGDNPVAKNSTGTGLHVRFESLPLSDVLDYVRETAGINMIVNWNSLAKIGVGKDTKVSMNLYNVSLGRVLDIILDSISGTNSTLDRAYCVIEGNILTIGTGHDFNTKTSSAVFDIADQLMPIPDFQGPRFNMSSIGSSDQPEPIVADSQQQPAGQDRKAMVEQLMNMIKKSIPDEMWEEGKASICIVGDKLVITQSQLGWKLLAQNL